MVDDAKVQEIVRGQDADHGGISEGYFPVPYGADRAGVTYEHSTIVDYHETCGGLLQPAEIQLETKNVLVVQYCHTCGEAYPEDITERFETAWQ